MSGLAVYDRPQKEGHRGWIWNRACERLPVHRRDAMVAYLLGPDDIDRRIALRRGFQNHNLIGIDTSRENVERCRRNGGLAVQMNLSRFMTAWDVPLHMIYADSCSSGNLIFRMLGNLFYPVAPSNGCCSEGAVVALNMVRGRESEPYKTLVQSTQDIRWRQDIKTNRGRAAFLIWMTKFAEITKSEFVSLHCRDVGGGRIQMNRPLVKRYENMFCPQFNTYRSKTICMDSVVMCWPVPLCEGRHIPVSALSDREKRRFTKDRAKLAALKAVRTRMKRAEQ